MHLSVLYSCLVCGLTLIEVVVGHAYGRKMPTEDLIKQQSIRCNINCPYGFVSDVEGETTCRCFDPCSSVMCFEGYECVAWMPESCRWEQCKAEVACRESPKASFIQKIKNVHNALPDPPAQNDTPYLADSLCEQVLPEAAVTSCRHRRRRWYYNTMTGQCVKFLGCPTAGNNFERKRDCKDQCRKNVIHPAILRALAADDSHCFEPAPFSSPDCTTKQRHWFYNDSTGKCEKFMGCDTGNTRNRFNRKLICKAKCHKRMRQFRLDAISGSFRKEKTQR